MRQTAPEGVREAIIAALERTIRDAGRLPNGLGDDTDLVALGLIDSVSLLDVLLEVEVVCGREFDPERLELEDGVTVRKLVAAFGSV